MAGNPTVFPHHTSPCSLIHDDDLDDDDDDDDIDDDGHVENYGFHYDDDSDDNYVKCVS